MGHLAAVQQPPRELPPRAFEYHKLAQVTFLSGVKFRGFGAFSLPFEMSSYTEPKMEKALREEGEAYAATMRLRTYLPATTRRFASSATHASASSLSLAATGAWPSGALTLRSGWGASTRVGCA